MGRVATVAWSERAEADEWIKERLEGRPGSTVTSVVPSGFEAYARILHPARRTERNGAERVVRWSDVAGWTNMPFEREVQFHSVALPPERPRSGEPPWSCAPRRGTLT